MIWSTLYQRFDSIVGKLGQNYMLMYWVLVHQVISRHIHYQYDFHDIKCKYEYIWVRSCGCGCLVTWFLLSNDSKTRKQDSHTFVTWPIYTGYFFTTIQHVRVNSSPPGQNGRHFADNIFSCIFTNEKFCILKKNHLSLFLRVQLTITQH